MNHDNPQAHLEHLVLLRSSGEITAPQTAELERALAENPALAAFSQALDHVAALRAKAPRDFAAEAIAELLPASATTDFVHHALQQTKPRRASGPRRTGWVLAATAAAAAVIVFISVIPETAPSPLESRTTAAISQRLDSIEQDLASPISSRHRSRSSHRKPS